MLKLILCSGLYPQVAIADEFNNYKRDCDQFFHTKVFLNFHLTIYTRFSRLNNSLFSIQQVYLHTIQTIFSLQLQLKQTLVQITKNKSLVINMNYSSMCKSKNAN